jgi:phytoene desaturase
MNKNVAVIGSGVGGIASAIRLKNKGYNVTVFEKNSYLGGKLSEIKKDGFRFDSGPSLLTLPELIDDLFYISKKNPRDYIDFIKLESSCRYFYPDKTIINAYNDINKFALEIQNNTIDKTESVYKYLKKSEDIYNITSNVFLFRSLHKINNFLNKDVLNGILNIQKVDVFRTMNQANEKLFRDPKTIQLFNRYATYNGSNPYKAPATLNVISHLEHNRGAYIAKGGMYSVISSLSKLSQDLGIETFYNSNIEKINIEKNRIKGIKVNSENKDFDIVVNNMDVINSYKTILKDVAPPKHLLKQEGSSSALIFYWGIKGNFPKLDVHNIFFSDNYKKEFSYLFDEHEIYKEPTVYVYVSSKINKEDAPEDCENWFVMINVPYNSGQEWENLIKNARKNIINKLNNILEIDLDKYIINENILDPRLIESKTSSYRGSLYGISSNNKYAAFLRHPNFLNNIENLYFCGGSVHPGGGIPLALASAKILSDCVS